MNKRYNKTLFRSLRSRIRESIDFIVIFVGVFIVGMGILNYKVFMLEFHAMFGTQQELTITDFEVQQHVAQMDEAMTAVEDIDISAEPGQNISLFEYDLDKYLAGKIDSYQLAFNTYVPGKRLVIDAINVDAPIVDIKAASQEKLEQGAFDLELTQGVVKYPFTTNPGEIGNTLIFGHSSVDSRKDKKNKRGYVFYKLPKLVNGDLITLYRDGQIYQYEVDKKDIKRPKQVAEEVAAHDDNRYLTLMACYPLLSDAKRILVRAKHLKSGNQLAHNSSR